MMKYYIVTMHGESVLWGKCKYGDYPMKIGTFIECLRERLKYVKS